MCFVICRIEFVICRIGFVPLQWRIWEGVYGKTLESLKYLSSPAPINFNTNKKFNYFNVFFYQVKSLYIHIKKKIKKVLWCNHDKSLEQAEVRRKANRISEVRQYAKKKIGTKSKHKQSRREWRLRMVTHTKDWSVYFIVSESFEHT